MVRDLTKTRWLTMKGKAMSSSKILLGLVFASLVSVSVCYLVLPEPAPIMRFSDAEFAQRMGEINQGIDTLNAEIDKAQNDPAIIENLAQIKALEEELKRPYEPSRAEILRELDKLWDQPVGKPYVGDAQKEQKLLSEAGLR